VTLQSKDERRWILQNVLSAGKLPPVSYKYARDDDNIYSFIKEPATPQLPTLVGKLTTLDLRTCHGFPSDLTNNETRALCLAIKRSTVTTKLIDWEEPLMVGTALTLTVENMQEPQYSYKRLAKIVLRARSKFHGKPAFSNVKLLVEETQGTRLYFGKCMVFFKDNKGRVFVGVRWYENQTVNGRVLDPTVKLARLKLATINVTLANVLESVSILPADCINNGALLIPCNNEYWAMMSSTEQDRYVLLNQY
jgi:ribosomal protein L35AE/L33A